MVDLKELQKAVIDNKIKHGFNTTDVKLEFLLAYGELNEAFVAWDQNKSDLGEELADVAIYLLGISEIVGVDLEKEIIHKMEKNKKRVYKIVDGVYTKTEGMD